MGNFTGESYLHFRIIDITSHGDIAPLYDLRTNWPRYLHFTRRSLRELKQGATKNDTIILSPYHTIWLVGNDRNRPCISEKDMSLSLPLDLQSVYSFIGQVRLGSPGWHYSDVMMGVKGTHWNITQNNLPIQWMMYNLFIAEILRVPRFTSS